MEAQASAQEIDDCQEETNDCESHDDYFNSPISPISKEN